MLQVSFPAAKSLLLLCLPPPLGRCLTSVGEPGLAQVDLEQLLALCNAQSCHCVPNWRAGKTQHLREIQSSCEENQSLQGYVVERSPISTQERGELGQAGKQRWGDPSICQGLFH